MYFRIWRHLTQTHVVIVKHYKARVDTDYSSAEGDGYCQARALVHLQSQSAMSKLIKGPELTL